jgi:phosphatidylserine/phosphatidylglycerophosphate/cardiolipin synthase-like enzyme
VAIYDLENEQGTPIYVHAKAVVVDDVWAMVGSANLNRRSWTHDSEVACAVLDQECDSRQPVDPGGLGDGARVFARQLRLRLWREHLGLGDADADDARLLDPIAGFEAWSASASRLQAWHDGDRRAPRPPAGSGLTRWSSREPSRPAGPRRCTGSPLTPTAAPCRYDVTPPSSRDAPLAQTRAAWSPSCWTAT